MDAIHATRIYVRGPTHSFTSGGLTACFSPRRAFKSRLTAEKFMSWEENELRMYGIGRHVRGLTKLVFKTYLVRAPYDHIISQLVAEVDHGEAHDTHESRRRQEYAKRLLDLFAIEAERYKGDPMDFYPKTLTPILVRQLNGVHDASSTVVEAVVSRNKPPATSEQTIKFYLGKDPTSPSLIPHYRRQLLSLPIPRWHLAVLLKATTLGNGSDYNRFHDDHYTITRSIHQSGYPKRGPNNIPLLNEDEVAAIVCEGLTSFFDSELNLVVWLLLVPCCPTPTEPHTIVPLFSLHCTRLWSSTTASHPPSQGPVSTIAHPLNPAKQCPSPAEQVTRPLSLSHPSAVSLQRPNRRLEPNRGRPDGRTIMGQAPNLHIPFADPSVERFA
jgi:hypothetical protein